MRADTLGQRVRCAKRTSKNPKNLSSLSDSYELAKSTTDTWSPKQHDGYKIRPSCDDATEQHDFSSQSARGVHYPAWEKIVLTSNTEITL